MNNKEYKKLYNKVRSLHFLESIKEDSEYGRRLNETYLEAKEALYKAREFKFPYLKDKEDFTFTVPTYMT